MSKIVEISHKSDDGMADWAAFGMLTAGAGFLCPPAETHTVVVQRGNELATGTGSTHKEATTNAVEKLS
jgi:hypothetical protein